jgi:ankyrin repeat protein
MECLFDEDKPHFGIWLWIYDDSGGLDQMSTMRPEISGGMIPLYHAARHGFRDLAAHLIAEHPEHVNANCDWGHSPLHGAAGGGNIGIVSLLLEHDVDVDSQEQMHGTPLHLASCHGTVSIGQCLDYGANINAQGKDRFTPLMLAVSNGHVDFAQMLVSCGAVIDARDFVGKTSLHFAVESGNIQVA